MRSLKQHHFLLPTAISLLIILAMLIHGPIVQLPNYHHFADLRPWQGISHAADVISNFGFMVVGIWGLHTLTHHPELGGRARIAYALFCFSIALTALGSSWYHLAPDNARLVFDRIPIAMACAALLAATLLECSPNSSSHRRDGALCWGLMAYAIASVIWWRLTDIAWGEGDLRPYLLLQILPIIVIPLLQWQAQIAPKKRAAFATALGLYVFAKITEQLDHAIFAQLGFVSGHTIKHLLATLAAGILVWQIKPNVSR